MFASTQHKTIQQKSSTAIKILIAVLLSLVLCSTSAEAMWYDAEWKYRKQITLLSAQVPNTDQTDFPVLIQRINDNDLLNNGTQADGGDILFTASDGTTQLSHEIESYNPLTGTLNAWVKIPTLSATTDTVIYMYYGNTIDTSNQWETDGSTWDTNFRMVLHLDESPADNTPGHLDSTANSFDSTPRNFADGNGGSTNATGKIDGADLFHPTDDYVDIPNTAIDGQSDLTLEMWFRTSKNGQAAIYSAANPGNNNEMLVFIVNSTTIHLYTGENGGSQIGWTVPNLSDNQWHHLVVTRDDSNNQANLYFDGTPRGLTATPLNPLSISPNGFLIGQEQDSVGGNFSVAQAFNGTLDEARISTSIRSADWIQTTYNNQNNPATFYNIAPQEQAQTRSTSIKGG